MSFTVDCSAAAISQLADVWLRAADKMSVRNAENRLERELSRDPENFGRHLSEGLWIAEVHPLVAYFEIANAERIVRITDIILIE